MPTALPRYLEVEIGTYCNRRCAWCPNGWHDRGLQRDVMPAATFAALLADLSAHRYAGWFAFHNYNEPLADPLFFERLVAARAALPHAKLDVHSNGDFLTPEILRRLAHAGLDALQVTLYPTDEEAFDPLDRGRIDAFLAKVGVARRGREDDRPSKIERTVRVGRLALFVRLPRIERYHDRAGAVGLTQLKVEGQRTAPCHLPTYSAAIDVQGTLKLCCNLYDVSGAAMAPYRLGNVAQTPFSTLWKSPRMQQLRAQLAEADFNGLSACAGCSHRAPDWVDRRALRPARGVSDPFPEVSTAAPRSTQEKRGARRAPGSE